MGWILEHKQWSNIAIIYSLLYLAVQFPIFSKCKNEHINLCTGVRHLLYWKKLKKIANHLYTKAQCSFNCPLRFGTMSHK